MFDIIGNKIKLGVEDLAIPPFKEYYNGCKDKNSAEKDIEYIVWLYKWNTPYRAYSPKERPSKVAKDVYNNDKFVPSEKLKALADKFNEFQSTTLIRLYTAAEDCAEYIIEVLKNYSGNCDYYDLDTAIKVSKLLKDVEPTAKSLTSAKNRAMAEQVETGKVKGGGTLGLYEMPRNN